MASGSLYPTMARSEVVPDALFDDPYAARPPASGDSYAAAVPHRAHRGWSIVARTKLIDDLVLSCVGEGCDRVLNLAAGLDTRPYCPALPASLTWVSGLPGIIEEKERLMVPGKPRLPPGAGEGRSADAAVRGTFLARAIGPRCAPWSYRGLLLPRRTRRSITRARSGDSGRPCAGGSSICSPAARDARQGDALQKAPWISPPSGVGFFESLGWRARDIRSISAPRSNFTAPLVPPTLCASDPTRASWSQSLGGAVRLNGPNDAVGQSAPGGQAPGNLHRNDRRSCRRSRCRPGAPGGRA
jgi:hypothetical protein